jgi:hypothetical protein
MTQSCVSVLCIYNVIIAKTAELRFLQEKGPFCYCYANRRYRRKIALLIRVIFRLL